MILALILAAGLDGTWTPATQLEALACVRAWENLCAVNGDEFPEVQIEGKKVRVRPFMDDSEIVFEVVSATPKQLTLSAKEGKATLSVEGDALVYVGFDVGEKLRGKEASTRLKLVRAQRVNEKKAALVKKLVPGGACEGLMGHVDTPKTAKCLNSP